MQQQKKTSNFDQKILQQLQTNQIQIFKLCKAYSQQLQIQCRYKDSLIESQRQKYKLQIQQQKQRYQRMLEYEIENNKMVLECQRDNYKNLIEQERNKFQFEKEQIYRQMSKQREYHRSQMKQQAQYIQKKCVENLTTQFKYSVQNICHLFINQNDKQGLGEKIMKYFERLVQNMQQQLAKKQSQQKKKENPSPTKQLKIKNSLEFDELTLKCTNLQQEIEQKNEIIKQYEKKISELQKKINQNPNSLLLSNLSNRQKEEIKNQQINRDEKTKVQYIQTSNDIQLIVDITKINPEKDCSIDNINIKKKKKKNWRLDQD